MKELASALRDLEEAKVYELVDEKISEDDVDRLKYIQEELQNLLPEPSPSP